MVGPPITHSALLTAQPSSSLETPPGLRLRLLQLARVTATAALWVLRPEFAYLMDLGLLPSAALPALPPVSFFS